MTFTLALKFAARELRNGLRGFRVFLACLILGVGAITTISTLRSGLQSSITQEGATLLGGDASIEFTYRFASPKEHAWMEQNSQQISEVVDLRSMAVAGEQRILTKLRAVDTAYPLIGQLDLSPNIPITQALDNHGIIVERILAEQLDVAVNDTITLGTQSFTLRAIINRYPDNSSASFDLGARSIVKTSALSASGLLAPGTLFTTRYRMQLASGADLAALKSSAQTALKNSGHRWRDRRNSARNLKTFIDRIGAFLTLLALSSLAVGGIGIYAATQSYISKKSTVIATLKTIGATRKFIIATYSIQITALAALGILIGLVLGSLIPSLITPLLSAYSPIPISFTPSLLPLLEATVYGMLTTALFTLWPIAKTENIRAATLFQGQGSLGAVLPRKRFIALSIALFASLFTSAAIFSNNATLTLWTFGAIIGAIALLLIASTCVGYIAKHLQKRMTRAPMLRWALSTIASARSDRTVVTLSIGLGLSILAIVGQVDSTLRRSFSSDLPQVAPSYFFIDIQPQQITDYQDLLKADPQITQVDTAPMLRANIININGQKPNDQAKSHWVIRGDRGISYANEKPKTAKLTAGAWWTKDYNGPPQISFAQEEARELGLHLGDTLDINVLGRTLTGTITSFRDVNFADASIDFVLIINESALKGAPHSWISTVYTNKENEVATLRSVSQAFPNLTAIHIRAVIEQVGQIASSLSQATTYAALMTLFTGFLVLIGTSAASHQRRVYDSAIFKTIGATRADILKGLAFRSALLGLSAALIALSCGILGGWAVATFLLSSDYIPNWTNVFMVIGMGLLISFAAESAFAWKTLKVKTARTLRTND